MDKHTELKKVEFDEFQPNPSTIGFIKLYCEKTKKSKEEIKILDWGCSRGKEVLWLRENGYHAFGVDIDGEPVGNGKRLAAELGYDEDKLQVLNKSGSITNYPDNHFDIIFSNQVLEHVKDINVVASEIYRITKKDGEGYHVFPGFLYPNEGHLHMPLVHWMPKNYLRYMFILFYVLIGREPKWNETEGLNKSDTAKLYFNYSVNKTFYRSPWLLNKVFSNEMFKVAHYNHDILKKGTFSLFNVFNKVKQFLRIIFFEDELYLKK